MSFAGKVSADAENPLPVTEREFTVTAAVPLEVSVTTWVVGVFSTTAPNATLLALSVSVGTPGFS